MSHYGRTIDEELEKAVYRLDLTQVKYLVHKGANVKAERCSSRSPGAFVGSVLRSVVYLAKRNEYKMRDILQYFIDNGADINKVCGDGNTAFTEACKVGFWNTVQVMVRNGANINQIITLDCDRFPSTPLAIASYNRHRTVIGLLLYEGANPKLKNNQGGLDAFESLDKGFKDLKLEVDEIFEKLEGVLL